MTMSTAIARVTCNLPDASYDVSIGLGLLNEVGAMTAALTSGRHAMLVVDHNVYMSHGPTVERSLESAGFDFSTVHLTADESHKMLGSVVAIYESMLDAGLDRNCPVVALGGGIIGDTAGFAAASYMRGVPLIQVPTTLLAMVDAAVGGKTGVNFPLPDGGLGKNLIGAFWQPRAVIADPQTLRTLNKRDFRCGLAECIKCGLIADVSLLDFLEANVERMLALDMVLLSELIQRSVRIKCEIVEKDERESGLRALLNLGHTFAHAIESVEELQLRHGEAVAIGMMAAGRCAVETGRVDEDYLDRVGAILDACGLPRRLPRATDLERLLRAMKYDKKACGGRMRLVLPTAMGRVEVVEDAPIDGVHQAWASVGAAVVASGEPT